MRGTVRGFGHGKDANRWQMGVQKNLETCALMSCSVRLIGMEGLLPSSSSSSVFKFQPSCCLQGLHRPLSYLRTRHRCWRSSKGVPAHLLLETPDLQTSNTTTTLKHKVYKPTGHSPGPQPPACQLAKRAPEILPRRVYKSPTTTQNLNFKFLNQERAFVKSQYTRLQRLQAIFPCQYHLRLLANMFSQSSAKRSYPSLAANQSKQKTLASEHDSPNDGLATNLPIFLSPPSISTSTDTRSFSSTTSSGQVFTPERKTRMARAATPGSTEFGNATYFGNAIMNSLSPCPSKKVRNLPPGSGYFANTPVENEQSPAVFMQGAMQPGHDFRKSYLAALSKTPPDTSCVKYISRSNPFDKPMPDWNKSTACTDSSRYDFSWPVVDQRGFQTLVNETTKLVPRVSQLPPTQTAFIAPMSSQLIADRLGQHKSRQPLFGETVQRVAASPFLKRVPRKSQMQSPQKSTSLTSGLSRVSKTRSERSRVQQPVPKGAVARSVASPAVKPGPRISQRPSPPAATVRPLYNQPCRDRLAPSTITQHMTSTLPQPSMDTASPAQIDPCGRFPPPGTQPAGQIEFQHIDNPALNTLDSSWDWDFPAITQAPAAGAKAVATPVLEMHDHTAHPFGAPTIVDFVNGNAWNPCITDEDRAWAADIFGSS